MCSIKDNAKQIRIIETKIARYIFNTYIKTEIMADDLDNSRIQKSIFMNKIFLKSKGIITQDELLKDELAEISKANKEYNLNLDRYKNNKRTVFGYPDEYRCQYILYNKHKFMRCKQKINTDSGIHCALHSESINKYKDDYNKCIVALQTNT
jgi:hypothetical protein